LKKSKSNQPKHSLELPQHSPKPRTNGITVLIDNGVPINFFKDVVDNYSHLIDYIKFGWGTSLITDAIGEKISYLRKRKIGYFFGGTLFEKFYSQGKVEEFVEYCQFYKCPSVEISDGTLEIPGEEKVYWIETLSKDFEVFSEVGYKAIDRSRSLHPAKWIEFMKRDLDAGASYVILEARESGKSGICRETGEVRYGLIEEVLSTDIRPDKMVFEAPNSALQKFFVQRIGSNVNVANIPFADIIPLETLRLGLRSDTLTYFDNVIVGQGKGSRPDFSSFLTKSKK